MALDGCVSRYRDCITVGHAVCETRWLRSGALFDNLALAKHASLPWTLAAPNFRNGKYVCRGPAVVMLESSLGLDAEDMTRGRLSKTLS